MNAARHLPAGVYPANVRDLQGPDGQGRVRIELSWLGQDAAKAQAWARLATLMAGKARGTWFIPEVGDEVLMAFQGGDASRAGHRLLFDDASGSTKVEVETAGGHRLTLDDAGGGTVTLEHMNGAKVVITAAGNVEITANAQVKVDASRVNVSAGMVQVDAGMSRFSGVVQCDTLITDAVVSAGCTPGAGNIW
jgi:uncharacterized protein involved in type VI secretion and phage assembly